MRFQPRHRWTGWSDDGALNFVGPEGSFTLQADATVLALGGASWPRLGSDGGWVDALIGSGVKVTPLAPANCGFMANWSDVFRDRHAGQPLKRIELAFGGRTARGEAIVTQSGLEGGAIYALSPALREAIGAAGEAIVHIELRPDSAAAALESRLAAPRGKQSLSTFLRKTVALAPVAVGLLHEATIASSERLSGHGAGGARRAHQGRAGAAHRRGAAGARDLDSGRHRVRGSRRTFMLRHRPGVFVAGEMLDWEAPTGGYLLQASFATGAAAARGALQWLGR